MRRASTPSEHSPCAALRMRTGVVRKAWCPDPLCCQSSPAPVVYSASCCMILGRLALALPLPQQRLLGLYSLLLLLLALLLCLAIKRRDMQSTSIAQAVLAKCIISAHTHCLTKKEYATCVGICAALATTPQAPSINVPCKLSHCFWS